MRTINYIPRISKLLSNSWLSFKVKFSKEINPCSFISYKRSNCSISWLRLCFAFTLAIIRSLSFSYTLFEFALCFILYSSLFYFFHEMLLQLFFVLLIFILIILNIIIIFHVIIWYRKHFLMFIYIHKEIFKLFLFCNIHLYKNMDIIEKRHQYYNDNKERIKENK